MHVIATSGHVDHGKSSLVKALTGTDPDRLPEEQARGMTIELGFARLDLGEGREAALIDVPGHERFVRHMVAGVGGIDLAVLVVAADESVMPQTREHLAILDLLGVSHVVVALTKSDLVETEWLALAEDEVRRVLATGRFAGSPIVPSSSVTGAGLDRLRNIIAGMLETVPDRVDRARPRLPIDRVFTRSGHGTVVTGTLIDGQFALGQDVELAPDGLQARVRGMQTHGRALDLTRPGSRLALNLAGVEPRRIRRGMVVCLPGTVPAARYLDLRVHAVPENMSALGGRASTRHPLYHNMPVAVHTGAAEAFGRLRLLDADTLAYGSSGWAQAILEEPLAVLNGDRCILRTPSPAETIAGAVVIAVNPTRHRRFQISMLQKLDRLATSSPLDQVVDALAHAPLNQTELAGRTGLPQREVEISLQDLARAGAVVPLVPAEVSSGEQTTRARSVSPSGTTPWTTPQWLDLIAARALLLVRDFHAAFPLRRGMPGEALREALDVRRPVWSTLLAAWRQSGSLAVHGDVVSAPAYRVTYTTEQEHSAAAFIEVLAREPYMPPSGADLPPIDREVLDSLVASGDPVRLSDTVFLRAAAYRSMADTALRIIDEEGQVTVAGLRDAMPTNRKVALALLEYLDGLRVTRRVGEGRLRGRAALGDALRG